MQRQQLQAKKNQKKIKWTLDFFDTSRQNSPKSRATTGADHHSIIFLFYFGGGLHPLWPLLSDHFGGKDLLAKENRLPIWQKKTDYTQVANCLV